MSAFLAAEQGRLEEARAGFEVLAARSFSGVPLNLLWMVTMAWLAAVAARLDDRLRAAELHEMLLPYAWVIAGLTPLWFGSVSHYLGMLAATLGHYEEAGERFAAAEATHERFGAPAWLARTRLERARMLVRRAGPGDADRAQGLLGLALSAATELGLGTVERTSRALLDDVP